MQRRQKNPFELSRNEPRAKTKRECKMAAGTGEKTRWESLSLHTILPIWFSFPHEYEAWLKWKRAAGMHTNAGDAAATALYCVELILTPSHTHTCVHNQHTLDLHSFVSWRCYSITFTDIETCGWTCDAVRWDITLLESLHALKTASEKYWSLLMLHAVFNRLTLTYLF